MDLKRWNWEDEAIDAFLTELETIHASNLV